MCVNREPVPSDCDNHTHGAQLPALVALITQILRGQPNSCLRSVLQPLLRLKDANETLEGCQVQAPKTMAESTDAAHKKQKQDAAPAFKDAIPETFLVDETLKFEAGGRFAVVLGTLRGEACLLQLAQKAALEDPQALAEALPNLSLALTNHSGAEYAYYVATDPTTGATYDLEVVWPASERVIQRKRPAEVHVFEETAAIYEAVVKPFAEAQAANIGWIDAVCSLEKEKERNLHAGEDFVVNVDTKWATHGPFDSNSETWRGADWARDLYLLAIAKDASLKSIRDLRGDRGAKLVRAMRAALLKCALETYGVPAAKLRVFFHYQPQFYRLHAHCTRAEHTNPGCECDRAHLLSTVAANLDLAPDYYARAPLTYKLRVGEKLHGLLVGPPAG